LQERQASASSPPAIESARVEAGNIVVLVSVPSGYPAITLESRNRLGPGAWIPLAVQRPNGAATNLVFSIPTGKGFEALRVRGDETQPLPASFYQSTNRVAPPIATADPSSSSGSGLTPATFASAAGNTPSTPGSSSTRAVTESDIWQFSGDWLYFFNQQRGLQAIDISDVADPALRFTLPLPAVGEQMYLLDTNDVVLLAQDNCGNGNQNDIIVARLGDQGWNIRSRVSVDGSWSDSRMVGDVLYLASESYFPVASSNGVWEWGTVVSAIDLENPDQPVVRDSQTVSGYGNLVYATDEYFFVVTEGDYDYYNSTVYPFDITDPTGVMAPLPEIQLSGMAQNKFNLNFDNGVFSAISSAPTENWEYWTTELQNFAISSNNAFAPVGSLRVADGEQLQSSRFDGSKVYIVTAIETDPLWVVDNSDPTRPSVAGSVKVPGWSSLIYPLGGQLVTIGMQSNLVAVSLFDVSQPAAPALLSRVLLGSGYSWSLANWDDKAFNVIPSAGLILAPYSDYNPTNGSSSQVQIIELGTNSLALAGVISHPMQPERTDVVDDFILALTDEDLLSVDASNPDLPVVGADLNLAWDVSQVIPAGDYIVQVSESDPSAPTLRVTAASDTSTVLGQLVLTNLTVLGVTAQGGYAYVAQGATPYFFPIYFSPNGFWNWSNGIPLVLSVIDLTKLPAIQLVGQTMVTNDQGWGYSLSPLWLGTNLLVWSGNAPRFFPLGLGGIGGGGLNPGGPVIFGWPWWGSGGTLSAFNVGNPANPQFVSQFNIGTNGWGQSQAFAAGNLVYSSYELSFEITNQPAGPNWPYYYWIAQNYLQVVDYTDPANPTPRNPVEIPNQLAGVSPDGALVYTVGPRLNPTNYYDWSDTWLDASAYDGVSASLVDSIHLANNYPQAWLVSGTNVIIGRSGLSYTTTNVSPSAVDLWTLLSTGKFQLETSLALDQPVYNLQSLGAALALGQAYDGSLLAIDLSAAPSIQLLSHDPIESCLWFNLATIAGTKQDGLWVPLGLYGAQWLPLAP
jgi:uncharacterized secreted protein with C-terminal beta-propeller domain